MVTCGRGLKGATHEPIFRQEPPGFLTPINCREIKTATHVYIFFGVAGVAVEHELIPRLLSLSLCLDIALLKKNCDNGNCYDS